MNRFTEKRDKQNVIPLRQDGKTKWSLVSAGMGDSSTQFLYGSHADKLAEYEDLEERGLLVKLPCAIGTTVYGIDRQFFIDSKECKNCPDYYEDLVECFCDCADDYPKCAKVFEISFELRMIDEIGKGVFLTTEDAEKELRRLQNNKMEV